MSLLLILFIVNFLITHAFRAKPRQEMTVPYRTRGFLRLTKNSVSSSFAYTGSAFLFDYRAP